MFDRVWSFCVNARKSLTNDLSSTVLLIFVGIGIILRFSQYLANHSFFSDEAWVAISVGYGRTLSDIIFNRNHFPGYSLLPVAFLCTEKVLVQFFGICEYAFRAFPLLSGSLAVCIFAAFLREKARMRVAVSAMALFVFSGSLIHQSTLLKQYSTDVFFALVIYRIHFESQKREMTSLAMVLLFLAGLLSMLYSHSAVLVLSGCAVAQLYYYLQKRDIVSFRKYAAVCAFWAEAFLLIWLFYYRINFQNTIILDYQKSNFLTPVLLFNDWQVWVSKVLAIFSSPAGLTFTGLSGGLFLAGCIAVFRRDKTYFLQLTLPVFFTLIASMLSKYPFEGRFLLFLLPALYVLVSEGMSLVMEYGRWGEVLGVILFLSISAPLFSTSIQKFFSYGYPMAETRPLMEHLKSAQREGDAIVVNNDTQYAYAYYGKAFQPSRFINYKAVTDDYLSPGHARPTLAVFDPSLGPAWPVFCTRGDIAGDGLNSDCLLRLKIGLGKTGRLWVLFAQGAPEAEKLLTEILDGVGRRVETRHAFNASLYLYEL